jgi:hypothetical protein
MTLLNIQRGVGGQPRPKACKTIAPKLGEMVVNLSFFTGAAWSHKKKGAGRGVAEAS